MNKQSIKSTNPTNLRRSERLKNKLVAQSLKQTHNKIVSEKNTTLRKSEKLRNKLVAQSLKQTHNKIVSKKNTYSKLKKKPVQCKNSKRTDKMNKNNSNFNNSCSTAKRHRENDDQSNFMQHNKKQKINKKNMDKNSIINKKMFNRQIIKPSKPSNNNEITLNIHNPSNIFLIYEESKKIKNMETSTPKFIKSENLKTEESNSPQKERVTKWEPSNWKPVWKISEWNPINQIDNEFIYQFEKVNNIIKNHNIIFSKDGNNKIIPKNTIQEKG